MTVKTAIGEITASEETLNAIAVYAFDSARLCAKENHVILQAEATRVANTLFAALEKGVMSK